MFQLFLDRLVFYANGQSKSQVADARNFKTTQIPCSSFAFTVTLKKKSLHHICNLNILSVHYFTLPKFPFVIFHL